MAHDIFAPDLYINDTGTEMGRGVFAKRHFVKDEVVEIARVLIINIEFDALPELLQNYVFNWTALTKGEPHQQALPLGYGSMYNHDNPANLRYEAVAGEEVMRYIAVRDIAEGEQLTINYNAEGGLPVSDGDYWFDQRSMQPYQRHGQSKGDCIGKFSMSLTDEALLLKAPAIHHSAIRWVSTCTDVLDIKLISDNAWATTYRLSRASDSVYLKILPPYASEAIAKTAHIAKHFPHDVPKVISVSQKESCILFADHEGQDLEYDSDLIDVARKFALIQTKAFKSADLLTTIGVTDVMSIPDGLMSFLANSSRSETGIPPRVSASYFIGQARADRYAALLNSRLNLLRPRLEAAAALPKTLCHGDLQPRNLAVKPDGHIIYFDWDDASSGPAGLCLHGLFSGGTLPAILIDQWIHSGTPGDSMAANRLAAYVQTLADDGYCPMDVLLPGLIGSIVAGQMKFISSFGNFLGSQHRTSCAETLQFLLDDLLDFCDWLASLTSGAAMACAQDYLKFDEWRRAERLVQDVLSRDSHCYDALVLYSRITYQLGDLEAADTAARTAFSLYPESIDTRIAQARVCLGGLETSKCSALIDQVLEEEPDNGLAQELRTKVQTIISIRAAAAVPQDIPRIDLTSTEQLTGRITPDKHSLMVDLFLQHGVVQINHLFKVDMIRKLQHEFQLKYATSMDAEGRSDVLCVGDKRFMLTPELDSVFGSDELLACRPILKFMQSILGEEYTLSSCTAVMSFPGSAPQLVHKDHSALFPERGWSFPVPPFAVQLIVPLLELNDRHGTTRVFKGTQQVEPEDAVSWPHQDPLVPLGSCLLVDYSIAHCGMGNQSDKVRPIMNLVYSRPWFRDYQNYLVQPPLKFSQHYIDNASEVIQKLLGK